MSRHECYNCKISFAKTQIGGPRVNRIGDTDYGSHLLCRLCMALQRIEMELNELYVLVKERHQILQAEDQASVEVTVSSGINS